MVDHRDQPRGGTRSGARAVALARVERVPGRGEPAAFGDQLAGAGDLAERLLKPLGRRWQHTLGVVSRARSVERLLDQHEAEVLIAAAFLHDIGYAPELQDTMYHPLDGARFLRRHGKERLANLVGYHTGALVEAQDLGLERELSQFAEERSLVARLLTYCDLTTSPAGEPVAAAVRLEEIIERYGDAAPARAARRSRPLLLKCVREIEELLVVGTRPLSGDQA